MENESTSFVGAYWEYSVCSCTCTWEDVVVARATIQLPPSRQCGRPAYMLQRCRSKTVMGLLCVKLQPLAILHTHTFSLAQVILLHSSSFATVCRCTASTLVFWSQTFFFQRKCHYHVIAGVTGSGHLIWVSQWVPLIFTGQVGRWQIRDAISLCFFCFCMW